MKTSLLPAPPAGCAGGCDGGRDHAAGRAPLPPYKFDITKLLQAGRNRIKIIIANSMENARVVENHADLLPNLKLDGLLGRVQVIPYLDAKINCQKLVSAGARAAKQARTGHSRMNRLDEGL